MTKFLFLLFISFSKIYGQLLVPSESIQMMIVTTSSWVEQKGKLVCYEKDKLGIWNQVGEKIDVILGINGMAWGIGIVPNQPLIGGKCKFEGDGRSPSGIFKIGPAFGFATIKDMSHLKIPYFHLTETIEAVDDPSSKYYNQIVDRAQITDSDWKSSELMSSENLYEKGIVIQHNPQCIPDAGSAIFMHIWSNSDSYTAGCTAMAIENLEWILLWLDAEKNPILVQAPAFIEVVAK